MSVTLTLTKIYNFIEIFVFDLFLIILLQKRPSKEKTGRHRESIKRI